jgi:hypothetical protein
MNQQRRIGDLGMTQDDKIPDIIDIDPSIVVESDAKDVPHIKTRKNRPYGIFGLGAGALLLSAFAGGWFYKDVLATYFPSNQTHALQARVDAVELGDKQLAQKLNAVVGLTDELKSQLGAAQAAAEDARKQASDANTGASVSRTKIAELEKSLALALSSVGELKDKISTGVPVGGSVDTSGLTARLDTLEKSINDLNIANTNADTQNTKLSQTYSDLKAKIAAGSEFSAELKSITAIIPAAEGLDIMTSDASKGIPPLAALSDNLKTFAAQAAKPADTAAVQDDSLWGKTTSMFSGLITIRNTGEVDWAPVALQGAALVDDGKLVDAVKLLEQNLNVMPQALQDWRILANKRIAVDQAVEQLGRAVTRQIAARG